MFNWLPTDKIASYPVLARLGIFTLILLIIWLPIALPFYLLLDDQNLISIITSIFLYTEFIILLKWWGNTVYQQPKILQQYGLVFSRRNGRGLLQGLAIGLISLSGLFLLEGWFGWLIWQTPSPNFPWIILEGGVLGLAVAFAEELLFRGWLLSELERDLSNTVALWVNSLIFASLHFIKPLADIIYTLPQFFGLLILGIILVLGRRIGYINFSETNSIKNPIKNSMSRPSPLLGLPMGIHGGLVWGYYLINVGNLVKYVGTVPTWVTGIHNNPLAGIMGLSILGAIALWLKSQQVESQSID
jgi:membrane protease YdiL (CAAX protease family)